ncbi:MAG: polyphosphate:AMP phosphotransferase [Actinomycetia bacterium]|nr:polyphosphate:AMP phosphotransferase [Actinomycetes bacterium]MCH9700574.1 polyphosphate:AMP phosphotransferase [Actinomycetes bacterium]
MLEVSEVGNKIDKSDYKAAIPELRVGLINAQYDLRDADFPVIIWIAGDDRLGANALVNRLNEWMDSRYADTQVFAEPTEEESQRPQLWRLWRSLPPKGRASFFVGGLMRAASMRAEEEIDEPAFSIWLRHIANMQHALVADGALILKFFLHTPARAQKKNLKEAERHPELGWQIDQRDWAALDTMGPVLPIAERILRETSGPGAPWSIVESTDARYRDLTVARTILAALTTRLAQKSRPSAPSLAESVFGDIGGAADVLSGVDLTRTLDKEQYRTKLAEHQARLHGLAAEARKRGLSTVLAFEGWDAAGKGGVIRRITGALEAGDYRVIPVAAPTEEERKYHYLWRFWRDLPRAGKFVIFDRTWYGRVLVERLEGFADPAEWQRAYDEINDFENQLLERGIFVAKFWLHVSPEEQLARFTEREDTPYKAHKITAEDYRNRERWDDYVKAVDQMILRTTSDGARWNVIPADDKRYARVAALKAINKGLATVLRES